MDRDGTLIEHVPYLSDPAHVRLVPGAPQALAALREDGFKLVLVSNQSGVGRGLFSRESLRQVDARMTQLLAAEGVRLDATYYCEHAPEDDCACRKPRPGMLLRAADEHGLDLTRSFMIGDAESDMEAGRRAGCGTIHFGHGAAAWDDVVKVVRAQWRNE